MTKTRSLPLLISRLLLGAACLLSFTLPGTQAQQDASTTAWRCLRGDGQPCSRADLENSNFRQILVLSTAYPEALANLYWQDFETLVKSLGSPRAGNAWSVQKRNRLLYVGHFTGGGTLGSRDASFDARIIQDPLGRPTLAIRNEALYRFVDQVQVQVPSLLPLAAVVLFNAEAGPASNSAPPSFTNRSYGVVRMNRDDLKSGYIPTHELGHGALNFLDEYVENGLEDVNIRVLDAATPRLIFGSRVFQLPGVYDYNISEILAGNGNVNLALRPDVTTVPTRGTEAEFFEYEGGLFFGRGTFHDAGNNLMNSNRVQRGPDDGFAFDHSPAQQRFIDTVFGDAPARPNDRLRNAGPVNGWWNAGSSVDLLLYDADKNNSWHPTQHYRVQVGWFERQREGPPQWRVDTYIVQAERRTADLPLLLDRPEDRLLVAVACRAGMTELSTELNGREVCDRPNLPFLPTMRFYLPYETATVPANQWFTTYYWRFSSHNGTVSSGWTGWSSFYRSF